MNAPFSLAATNIRSVDFSDVQDLARIDAYVQAHPDGSPFHLTAWGRAVAKGCRQRAHCLIAESGTGVISGVLPLTELRSRLFGRALISNGFAVRGGPLADDERAGRALVDASWSMAQALGVPSVELRGPVPESPDWQVIDDRYANFSRPLGQSDEADLLAIPRKQRAEVRRSLGFDLDVAVGRGAAERAAHYAVYAESVRNLGTPVFPRALFDAVLDSFGEDADILVVRQQGVPVAAVLSLYHGGVVMPYWGGGTHAARTWRANDRMYYELMKHARARGCSHFDFGRSKPGTGAFTFKKNWGFEPRPLSYAMRIADGATPREINPLNPKYRLKIAAWQKLPLPVANLIGPFISRGLG
ncbi:FemAB family XrtA/PEP-CTERM system-associated protein [Sphingomonas colocasiae]|uniref:FemAB family PEP-CTERM system-associated protein n=1 Tax=Sphingomonas colocasiae TaxID=1848973 RepID=A0ABS7PJ17_9SPHN|nr:FemAB family XrtA/PEP-CTERM system-associated protein [Sphingomonas colocasiae]MBY8821290.1 FemAB family PEP-CTERM system-associated protein [Sphingomonas colocasiae]